jgi:hypothetical protein
MARSFVAFAPERASDIIRQSAVEAGEIELMAQAVVDIAPADWARFEALVNGPARYAPGLAELARYSLPPVHGR